MRSVVFERPVFFCCVRNSSRYYLNLVLQKTTPRRHWKPKPKPNQSKSQSQNQSKTTSKIKTGTNTKTISAVAVVFALLLFLLSLNFSFHPFVSPTPSTALATEGVFNWMSLCVVFEEAVLANSLRPLLGLCRPSSRQRSALLFPSSCLVIPLWLFIIVSRCCFLVLLPGIVS